MGAGDFYSGPQVSGYSSSKAMQRAQREIAVRCIELLGASSSKLLDIGCGPGFTSVVFKQAGFQVSAVDPNPAMVTQAKSNGIRAKRGDFFSLPFGEASFDLIASASALQWIMGGKSEAGIRSNLLRAAREVARVLKHGGKLVVQFYPKSESFALLAASCFTRSGFKGGLQVDSPENPRKRRVFIVMQRA